MPSLEQRIQLLEDREAIRELIAQYCRGVDARDEAMFMSIWTDDAAYRISGPFGGVEGIEAIRGVLHGLWAAFSELHHWATNAVIEVDGDHARSWCDADVTGTDTLGRALMLAASYTDHLRRDPAGPRGWKFTNRDVELHYMTPVLQPWSSDPAKRYAEL
jgi:ketosteroid isomerase-like protein